MFDEITAIYCLCDDFTKALNLTQDPRSKMSPAEITATAVISCRLFNGNLDKTRLFLKSYHYVPYIVSKSRLCRLIHRTPEIFWEYLLTFLQRISSAKRKEFIVDSFPVPLCIQVRRYRCRLAKDKTYISYHAAKKEFYYGLKVHVITTDSGQPVEFKILPGSIHDMKAFKELTFRSIPQGSNIYGDRAYNNYDFEDFLWQKQGIALLPQRKISSQRAYSLKIKTYINRKRKRIETAFSEIKSWLGQKVHAVTLKGFKLKLTLTLVAFAFKTFLAS